MKTAVVIGATGATGRQLVRQLISHPEYSKVVALTRRTLNLKRKNYQEHLIDFSRPEQWAELMQGDELYSAMGTTIKQAGSKTAQYEVDFSFQLNAAKAAQKNGIPKFILVSSPNANSRSRNFYLRIKGELEVAVQALDFPQLLIFRPSIIEATRPDVRLGEKIAGSLLNAGWRWLPGLGKYRPIPATVLASAMINLANSDNRTKRIELALNEIFDFASPNATP